MIYQCSSVLIRGSPLPLMRRGRPSAFEDDEVAGLRRLGQCSRVGQGEAWVLELGLADVEPLRASVRVSPAGVQADAEARARRSPAGASSCPGASSWPPH